MRQLSLAVAIVFGLAAPTWADFEEGDAAYERGKYAIALKEWQPCAEQGDAQCQNGLGVLYEAGLGVPEDDAKAAKWYRNAAKQGNVLGQFSLGVMYDRGEGVAEDPIEAMKWYRKAAEQGHVNAQSILGWAYDGGWGVPQDYVLAHMWYNLTAVHCRPDDTAVGWLGARSRDQIAEKMTPDQVAEAQKLAREWWQKHQKAD